MLYQLSYASVPFIIDPPAGQSTEAGGGRQWLPRAASQRSASSAAMQPLPAAVTACL
jgi:hypothetical protein